MLPKYSYQELPSIENNKSLNFKKQFKDFLIYFVYHKIPSLVGVLVDLTIGKYLSKRFSFVRSDCDHFGSWLFLFLYADENRIESNKTIICLAKKGSIDEYWIGIFLDRKNCVIYNPILQILLAPFFFSIKTSVDVNGHMFLSYKENGIKYKKFPRMNLINSQFLDKSIKRRSFRNYSVNKILDSKYILFYARTGVWKYSTANSERNMPKPIIDNIIDSIDESINIVLIGDTPVPRNQNKSNIYSLNELINQNISLYEIYHRADYVIGSISGATHFPSLLFNKPTLYIGKIPLTHLDAIYLPPYKEEDLIQDLSIPIKDHWLLIDNNELIKLEKSSFVDIFNKFIKYKNIRNIPFFNSYSYAKPQINSHRTLRRNDQGNIHVHEGLFDFLKIKAPQHK